MSIQQISLNPDIKRLLDEGYNMELTEGNLVLMGVPYVNNLREIVYGTIYCPISLSGDQLLPPGDHTMRFCGTHPCNQFGKEDNSYVNSKDEHRLNGEIVGNYYFSAKPPEGNYSDYYTKFKKYVNLLSAPAISIDPGVCLKKMDSDSSENNSFCYLDTNTARAGISAISKKIDNQVISIIGLGGTGSYILDFISKTSVKRINLFDGDVLYNHNAFRIPGAASLSELKKKMFKTDFFKLKYSKLKKNIYSYPIFIDEKNLKMLDKTDFVFIAIDDTKSKGSIIKYLCDKGISFIDSAIGLTTLNDSVRGTVRSIMVTKEEKKSLSKIEINSENKENVYSTNIQIAELNSLNASISVIMWKRYFGFYVADSGKMDTRFTYSIGTGDIYES